MSPSFVETCRTVSNATRIKLVYGSKWIESMTVASVVSENVARLLSYISGCYRITLSLQKLIRTTNISYSVQFSCAVVFYRVHCWFLVLLVLASPWIWMAIKRFLLLKIGVFILILLYFCLPRARQGVTQTLLGWRRQTCCVFNNSYMIIIAANKLLRKY